MNRRCASAGAVARAARLLIQSRKRWICWRNDLRPLRLRFNVILSHFDIFSEAR